jgi:hypothetical protein
MDEKLPDVAVAEQLAARIAAVDAAGLPAAVREKCQETLIDVVGLCLAARNEGYVKSALAGGTTTARAPRSLKRIAAAVKFKSHGPTARTSTPLSRAGRCMPAR